MKYKNAYASTKKVLDLQKKKYITQEKAESLMSCIIYFGTQHYIMLQQQNA